MELTFKLDVQIDEEENWIAAGTKVKVSENPYYLTRFNGSTPVIITEGYTYEGEPITGMYYTEWFSNGSFLELS